jgi:hypothetical protein
MFATFCICIYILKYNLFYILNKTVRRIENKVIAC